MTPGGVSWITDCGSMHDGELFCQEATIELSSSMIHSTCQLRHVATTCRRLVCVHQLLMQHSDCREHHSTNPSWYQVGTETPSQSILRSSEAPAETNLATASECSPRKLGHRNCGLRKLQWESSLGDANFCKPDRLSVHHYLTTIMS